MIDILINILIDILIDIKINEIFLNLLSVKKYYFILSILVCKDEPYMISKVKMDFTLISSFIFVNFVLDNRILSCSKFKILRLKLRILKTKLWIICQFILNITVKSLRQMYLCILKHLLYLLIVNTQLLFIKSLQILFSQSSIQ